MNLEKFFADRRTQTAASRPELFNLVDETQATSLGKLVSDKLVYYVVDDYEEQLREYFAVQNPTLVFDPTFEEHFQDYTRDLARSCPLFKHGRWVYFPWNATVVHILEPEAFYQVRTARNKNLINVEEQKKFYDGVIGIAGLSVGNSVALAIALQGGGRRMRLADFDRLALTNTNRVRSGVTSLGLHKVDLTARQIYELNPYAELTVFRDGLTPDSIERFFSGPPTLDVIIDEIDNLSIKYLIREQARKNRLPLVMAADNGDNGVVDIERYDQDPATPFFHGRMGPITYDQLRTLDKLGIGRLIVKHIGAETVTERVHESMPAIGKTIVSWPQLGGAALLNGCAAAYAVRKILNNQPLEDNRALISLDEKLIPNYDSPAAQTKRQASAEAFKKMFGL